jgi:2-dehydropantoate 2-reductase
MRLGIYGAGAVGGHLAARLALDGHRVSVIARGVHLEVMRASGLTLRTAHGDRTADVVATDDPADCGVQDVLFVTVKAHSLAGIHEHLAPLISVSSLVVFAQNGMPWWYPIGLPQNKPRPPAVPIFGLASSFLTVMNPRQIIGAVVDASSEVSSPGLIHNTSTANRLALGWIDDRNDHALDALQSAVSAAGYISPPVASIRESVWLKLLRNMSTSPIAMATSNKSSIVRRDPMLGEIFLRMVREAMEIARAAGYPLDAITSPEKMLAETSDVVPSLLQDFRMDRQVEIDALLLAPLQFAREARLATPTIEAVAGIVQRLAADKGLTGPFY